MCKVLVICAQQVLITLSAMMNKFYDMTYQPSIDERKIDHLTLCLPLCSFQGARTYDAGFKLCCVCDMFEKRDVNSRGELWIIEAFHLANLPTINPSHSRLQNRRRTRIHITGLSQALCNLSPSCYLLPLLHLPSQRRVQNTNY
jgi:hypothetical protein